MIPIRRFVGKSVLCGIAAVTLAGCGRPREAVAEGKESATSAAPVRTTAAGVVVLGPDAPELRQMTIEPVRTVPAPTDEVIAPAKIEANPNRVGHAVLPVPGRIVKVMVKLGDSVTRGSP